MTEVWFYHLERARLEDTLVALLRKVQDLDKRAQIAVGAGASLEDLNAWLWTYQDDSFMPHGGPHDGPADQQPIYLTDSPDPQNKGNMLFLVGGADWQEPKDLSQYERCFDIFDGNDPAALDAARERWRRVKAARLEAIYWQQTPDGKWERKGA